MNIQHKNLASGRWYELSLVEQMANIGSEISRAVSWRARDRALYEGALRRAYELLSLTIRDERWAGRRKELTRVREVLNDAVSGGYEYKTRLEDLDRYFFEFALAARALK